MILYLKKVRDLLKKFVLVQVRHIPRAENSRADTLAKLETTTQEDISRLTPVKYLVEPSIDLYGEEVAPIEFKPSWIEPIWDYLIDGRLPDDPKRPLRLERGQPGSLIIGEAFTSEVFSHPSLSASQGKAQTTYSGKCTKAYAEIISELKH